MSVKLYMWLQGSPFLDLLSLHAHLTVNTLLPQEAQVSAFVALPAISHTAAFKIAWSHTARITEVQLYTIAMWVQGT